MLELFSRKYGGRSVKLTRTMEFMKTCLQSVCFHGSVAWTWGHKLENPWYTTTLGLLHAARVCHYPRCRVSSVQLTSLRPVSSIYVLILRTFPSLYSSQLTYLFCSSEQPKFPSLRMKPYFRIVCLFIPGRSECTSNAQLILLSSLTGRDR
jgi:hypothetical protein